MLDVQPVNICDAAVFINYNIAEGVGTRNLSLIF